MTSDPAVSGETLYNAACAFARASDSAWRDAALPAELRKALAERYATRAVGLLARARQADFFHSPITCANLTKDADLDPLRSHRDFQMLMSDLVFPAYPFAP